MKHLFWLFVGVVALSLYCSKNYPGDLQQFLLPGEWEMAFSSRPVSQAEEAAFHSYQTVNLPAALQVPDTARSLLLQQQFVLPGHFPDKQIYLVLGNTGDSLRVSLNGFSLNTDFQVLQPDLTGSNLSTLLEIDPSYLHFGKTNRLRLIMSARALPETLLTPRAGLYTRYGYLRRQGLAVEPCDFSLERNLHALLEDMARAWKVNDSTEMKTYFYPDSSRTVEPPPGLFQELVELNRRYHPVDIELYRPEFFRCPRKQVVLVLGEWRFHFSDGSLGKLPFQWQLTETPTGWRILGKTNIWQGRKRES